MGCKYETTYLVNIEWQDEPLADGRGKGVFVGFDEAADLLPEVLDVEHVIEAAVAVADHVKHQVAILLEGVNVVEDYQGVTVEAGRQCLACCPVDNVEQGLARGKNKINYICVLIPRHTRN